MADKITLNTLSSFQNDTSAVTIVNANTASILAGMDNTLSRDGTSPNQMNAPIDMNGQPIINLPAPVTMDSPLRLADVNSIISVIPTVTVPGLLRYAFKNINFNSANTDNALTFTLPAGVSRYTVNSTRICNASASLSTATAGVFTGVGGTGQTIAANQAITVTQSTANVNSNTQSLTITNGNTEAYSTISIFFRIGTAQGSAATADIVLTIIPLT